VRCSRCRRRFRTRPVAGMGRARIGLRVVHDAIFTTQCQCTRSFHTAPESFVGRVYTWISLLLTRPDNNSLRPWPGKTFERFEAHRCRNHRDVIFPPSWERSSRCSGIRPVQCELAWKHAVSRAGRLRFSELIFALFDRVFSHLANKPIAPSRLKNHSFRQGYVVEAGHSRWFQAKNVRSQGESTAIAAKVDTPRSRCFP